MTKKYRKWRRGKKKDFLVIEAAPLPKEEAALNVVPIIELPLEVAVEVIAAPPRRSFWDWLFRRR